MKKVFPYYRAIPSLEDTKKLIEFCCSISNKLTLSAHMSMYSLSSDELPKAIDDINTEYLIEDKIRRTKYVTDLDYKIDLLNTYHTHEEVMKYFDRLREYDLIELNNVKELLLEHIERTKKSAANRTQQINDNPDAISLPQNSYLDTKFTAFSHCTIGGGIYKVFSFKIDEDIKNLLLNKCDLLAFYSYENHINALDDPCFYYNDKRTCSICSHEKTFFLSLNDDQYKLFKELGIPH